MQLKFFGAAGTVTGSRYLLDTGEKKILVDCGLFQGYKPLRLRNWAPFPVSPWQIDDVVLTYAHLDHSKRIQDELGWRCSTPEHLEESALRHGSGPFRGQRTCCADGGGVRHRAGIRCAREATRSYSCR